MYARSASIILLALPLLASAAAFRRGAAAGSCDFDNVMCCDSAQEATSSSVSKLLGLLNIDVGSVTGLVGINCNPVTIVGLSGTSCTSQPLCCSNNSFKGVIALGCTDISL